MAERDHMERLIDGCAQEMGSGVANGVISRENKKTEGK